MSTYSNSTTILHTSSTNFHWTATTQKLTSNTLSTHHLCTKFIHVPTENTLQHKQYNSKFKKNVQRCRDGNVCEAYAILLLSVSFFMVCHPYTEHFLKCFLCNCIYSLSVMILSASAHYCAKLENRCFTMRLQVR